MDASGSSPKNLPRAKSALLGDYRLLALLGQGQFAQVYSAVHRRTGRLVAIKQTRHAREHTSQEAQVMQRLNHPNIVRAQSVSCGKFGYHLVLEYCEGGNLRSFLEGALPSHLANTLDTPTTTLPLTTAKHLISNILNGLSHLHQQGIVHGDLKPENIFLTYSKSQANPTLKIGDFGSAKFKGTLTRSRREIGSPTYAAPERFEGDASYASDLYSVGVILYELLLGNRPFSGTPDELSWAHQNQPIPLPSTLTPAAQQLLTTALHKQPNQRFPSADAMLSAVDTLSSTTTEPTTAPAIPSHLTPANLSQVITPIPSNGITASIEALLPIPQGCCIVTERSLHVLTPKHKLLSIARFAQPCWIAVSPSGKWFTAVAKQPSKTSKQEDKQKQTSSRREKSNSEKEQTEDSKELLQENTTTPSIRRQSKGMLGHIGNHSGHRWRRAITLTGPLLTTLCAQVLQIIALNNRYLLRVSTTATATYFECFTRRGQFIGEHTLNLQLTQVSHTPQPYRLVALSAPTQNAPATVILITLKPFQAKRIRLPVVPERISAFPWGYLVSYGRKGLLLDRSAQMTGQLTKVPARRIIAPISTQKILLANSRPSKTTQITNPNNPNTTRPTSSISSLLVADISTLDLGIIF